MIKTTIQKVQEYQLHFLSDLNILNLDAAIASHTVAPLKDRQSTKKQKIYLILSREFKERK